MTADCLLQKRE